MTPYRESNYNHDVINVPFLKPFSLFFQFRLKIDVITMAIVLLNNYRGPTLPLKEKTNGVTRDVHLSLIITMMS